MSGKAETWGVLDVTCRAAGPKGEESASPLGDQAPLPTLNKIGDMSVETSFVITDRYVIGRYELQGHGRLAGASALT